ncbi:hypothetical protein KIPB_004461 [Kipferlia bialata]|uniref:Uncharacterized protein n=1 Tax=Kipferlia bialata TaxID=797122 RepID=A0A9K3CTS6_9EUKA|nr:hypothetical protein KIPB_004461 [Kipferlia bialata]|eukprot:g4461.t1
MGKRQQKEAGYPPPPPSAELLRITTAPPHLFSHLGNVYNDRGYVICGVTNRVGKMCARTGTCPFHPERPEDPSMMAPDEALPLIQAKYPQSSCEGPRKWTKAEHQAFIDGLKKHGRSKWKEIAEGIETRTAAQVQSHAQKFFLKLRKTGQELSDVLGGEVVDKPVSKRKRARPSRPPRPSKKRAPGSRLAKSAKTAKTAKAKVAPPPRPPTLVRTDTPSDATVPVYSVYQEDDGGAYIPGVEGQGVSVAAPPAKRRPRRRSLRKVARVRYGDEEGEAEGERETEREREAPVEVKVETLKQRVKVEPTVAPAVTEASRERGGERARRSKQTKKHRTLKTLKDVPVLSTVLSPYQESPPHSPIHVPSASPEHPSPSPSPSHSLPGSPPPKAFADVPLSRPSSPPPPTHTLGSSKRVVSPGSTVSEGHMSPGPTVMMFTQEGEGERGGETNMYMGSDSQPDTFLDESETEVEEHTPTSEAVGTGEVFTPGIGAAVPLSSDTLDSLGYDTHRPSSRAGRVTLSPLLYDEEGTQYQSPWAVYEREREKGLYESQAGAAGGPSTISYTSDDLVMPLDVSQQRVVHMGDVTCVLDRIPSPPKSERAVSQQSRPSPFADVDIKRRMSDTSLLSQPSVPPYTRDVDTISHSPHPSLLTPSMGGIHPLGHGLMDHTDLMHHMPDMDAYTFPHSPLGVDVDMGVVSPALSVSYASPEVILASSRAPSVVTRPSTPIPGGHVSESGAT